MQKCSGGLKVPKMAKNYISLLIYIKRNIFPAGMSIFYEYCHVKMVRASASQLSNYRVEVQISKMTDDNSYVLSAGAGQYNISLTL